MSGKLKLLQLVTNACEAEELKANYKFIRLHRLPKLIVSLFGDDK